MDRRKIAKTLIASATGAALLPRNSQAQTCTPPCFPQTAAEIAAGITPVSYNYPTLPYDARRHAKFDSVADDATGLANCMLVASQPTKNASGVVIASGGTIALPTGVALITRQLNLPARVRLQGQGQQASVIQAASFTGPWMMNAINGTSSMFGSLLEDLTVDANDIPGLGCILADAWQENDGPRRCLIHNFTTYGIKYQTGAGGAALSCVKDCNIFASSSGASAGIRVEQTSSVGSFMLHVTDTTICGSIVDGIATPLPRGIDVVNDSTRLDVCHFEYCTAGIYLDGVGHHLIRGCSGGPGVTNFVEIAPTFTGTVSIEGCLRAGAKNFLKDNRSGGVGTITNVDPPNFHIGHAARALSADNTVKAWCVFDGTLTGTNAPIKGFNVTAVRRNAVGDYTVSFANPLTNPHAVLYVMTGLDTADGWWPSNKGFGLGTANFTVRRGGSYAGAKVDSTPVEVMVVGFGT